MYKKGFNRSKFSNIVYIPVLSKGFETSDNFHVKQFFLKKITILTLKLHQRWTQLLFQPVVLLEHRRIFCG